MGNRLLSDRSNEVFVFIQRDLGVGGVETISYDYMKYLKSKGYTVIWICDQNRYYSPTFKDAFEDNKIRIWVNSIYYSEIIDLTEEKENSRITFVSFYIDGYMLAEKFRKKFKKCPVNNFFFVNHYTGKMNYIETSFHNPLQGMIQKHLSRMFSVMNDNGNIRYCSFNHITSMKTHYGYNVADEEAMHIPPHFFDRDCFNRVHAAAIYGRDEFRIVAASRFDFPHKGFFIGLIKSFSKLKEEYPYITLTIIGDGAGRGKIIDEISKCNDDVQKAIHLIGMLSPEQLREQFKNANLNISAAGCCSVGAKIGTLSLPVRNYSMECETYGFFSDVGARATTCTEKGFPIEDYIVKALQMTKEEYIQRCEACYNYFDDSVSANNRIDRISNNNDETLSTGCIYTVRFLFHIVMLKTHLKRRLCIIKENGGVINTLRRYSRKDI